MKQSRLFKDRTRRGAKAAQQQDTIKLFLKAMFVLLMVVIVIEGVRFTLMNG
ncbi:MAG: hypothetical protein P8L17_01890 [Methylophilaceae bacterium]|nr:hypothetical protein [Methylophilaceae bacterium]